MQHRKIMNIHVAKNRSIVTSIICIVALEWRAAAETEIFASQIALEFGCKWLANPKMYVGIAIPNNYPYSVPAAVKLTKSINEEQKKCNQVCSKQGCKISQ